MVEDDQRTIGHLQLLNENQRGQIFTKFNATRAHYEHGRCIHDFFEEQVRRAPDALAVVYEDQSLSYAQLNARANQVARFLRTRRVGPDRLVGLCLERGLEMVIGLLGILKAGGAYVPLDSGYPTRRLSYLIGDATPVVVLTQESLQGLCGLSAAEFLCLDSQWAQVHSFEKENLERGSTGVNPDHLAYVIYTSGSTGEPKGVMVEHRSLANLLIGKHEFTEPLQPGVFLQKLSIGFDMSVAEVLRPLVEGAKLIVARPARQTDPQYLASLIDRFGVGYATFVPSLLKQMLPYWSSYCGSVSRVICGGEPLSADLAREFYQSAHSQCRLYNLYGPTETTISISSHAVPRCDYRSNIPIGRPHSNVLFYVLDANRMPVPIGVEGELYVGGECLARGYLNDPDLTHRKFVANPFDEARAPRLYRTGDLVRWLPEGVLEFIGRIDDQVKVRGYRIELGEIESQLREHEAVAEAVVMVREDGASQGGGAKRLVAYVTPGRKRAGQLEYTESSSSDISTLLDVDTLRAYLSERVPPYMVPAAFVVLQRLPSDTKREGGSYRHLTSEAYQRYRYEPPQGEIEITLAQIWEDLLVVERVGRLDDFFMLGGHSLLAVQVTARIQEAFDIDLPLRSVFERSTLAGIAGAVIDVLLEGQDASVVGFRTRGNQVGGSGVTDNGG